MHIARLLLLVSVCCCTTVAMAQKDKLERLMDYYAAHDKFNGTVLVVKKGAILLSKGYGYKDVPNKVMNTEHTIYPIGGNTRQFTAEVILQLDSKGRLGMEDKLAKYLPEYPGGDHITLRNLLTHSSGIYNYTKDPMFSGEWAEKPMNKEDVVERFKNQPLQFTPGSDFAFSNSDYFLLGMVIEKITMKKYERVVKEDILLTCGMSHSGFGYARLWDANKAIGYNLGADSIYTETRLPDSSITYASGALYSCTADLLQWHRALLHHRLLPKDWQDLLYTPHKNQYALGWNISHAYNRLFMEHGGPTNGYNSYIVRQENDDVLIVLLENVIRPGETEAGIANNIVQCLYDNKYVLPNERKLVISAPKPDATKNEVVKNEVVKNEEPAEKATKVSVAKLKKYLGKFEINPAFTLTFSLVDGELFATTSENKTIKLVPETDTMFRTEGMNAEIEFIKSGTGSVNKIVLHQQGQLIPGVRAD